MLRAWTFAGLCLLLLAYPDQLFSKEENIAIKSVTIEKIKVNTSFEMNEALKENFPEMVKGVKFLESATGYQMEDEHTFWLFSRDIEMITIMRKGLNLQNSKLVLNSVRRRSFFNDSNTVVQTFSPVQTEKIFRMMFTRIALLLLEKNQYPSENRNEWFLHGFSAYCAFHAEREMQNVSDKKITEVNIKKYYKDQIRSGKFDYRKNTKNDAWKAELEKNPEHTYAHAVLLTLFMIEEYGYDKVQGISSLMAQKRFEDAFREATEDKLEKFYKKADKKLYSELKETFQKES